MGRAYPSVVPRESRAEQQGLLYCCMTERWVCCRRACEDLRSITLRWEGNIVSLAFWLLRQEKEQGQASQDIWDRIYRTCNSRQVPLVSCPSLRYIGGKQQEQESIG